VASKLLQRTTLCYIPEHRTVHNHRRENLKSCIMFLTIFTETVQDRRIFLLNVL
jgi:hypothetical protein